LENVEDFELSYYFYDQEEKKYLWRKDWDREGFPLAVRINLLVKNEEDKIQFRRTVQIPVAN
jgi:hypothetical protein